MMASMFRHQTALVPAYLRCAASSGRPQILVNTSNTNDDDTACSCSSYVQLLMAVTLELMPCLNAQVATSLTTRSCYRHWKQTIRTRRAFMRGRMHLESLPRSSPSQSPPKTPTCMWVACPLTSPSASLLTYSAPFWDFRWEYAGSVHATSHQRLNNLPGCMPQPARAACDAVAQSPWP